MIPVSLESTLFPYTTLFRSRRGRERWWVAWEILSVVVVHDRTDCLSQSSKWVEAMRASSPGVRDRSTTHASPPRSEEHTSELQSLRHLVCRLLLEQKNSPRL